MTVKEAILKVLEEQKSALTYKEVYGKINENKYIVWGTKTPEETVSAQLGHFIRQNDRRVKRVKGKRGFQYYLSKFKNELNPSEIIEKETETKKVVESKGYDEGDLHILLSSYLALDSISSYLALDSKGIYSKTISHNKSAKNTDKNQKWVHPDMIGIHFLNLTNESSNSLMKAINKSEAFNLFSYEIKKEIKSDYELKKCFFQAVSNSSWANYGYLVAFDINKDDLNDEMERLSQSFGIGIIELSVPLKKSEILFPAKFKELDFKTIDKICDINEDFKSFIEQTKDMLTTTELKYLDLIQKKFQENCDSCYTDSDIEKYCKENNIPFEEEEKTV